MVYATNIYLSSIIKVEFSYWQETPLRRAFDAWHKDNKITGRLLCTISQPRIYFNGREIMQKNFFLSASRNFRKEERNIPNNHWISQLSIHYYDSYLFSHFSYSNSHYNLSCMMPCQHIFIFIFIFIKVRTRKQEKISTNSTKKTVAWRETEDRIIGHRKSVFILLNRFGGISGLD
jgi:hypothetical protein